MTSGLRWRILVLQVGLIGIFGSLAIGLLLAGNFSHNSVTNQLAQQKISFPAADDKSVAALPAADAANMKQYGGQLMTTGDQAKVYAENYLGVHLAEMPTYAAASAAARANPNDTKAANTLSTVFKGITLQSMLLNSYGWWSLGTYAIWGGIGLAVAAFAVLIALAFEVYRFYAVRQREPRAAGIAPRPVAAH